MTRGEEGDVLHGVHDEDCTRLVPVLGEELDRVSFLVVRDGRCYFIMISGGAGGSIPSQSKEERDMRDADVLLSTLMMAWLSELT
jgi:hypothetical protein